jgi:hypothetical protein
MTYETRIVKLSVVPKNEQLFHNGVTNIEIIDEASGEFIQVSQCNDNNDGKIFIDPYEWQIIRAAIDKMIKECRDYK